MPALRVKESFSFDHDGVPVIFVEGQIVDSEDERITKERRHFFETVEAHMNTRQARVESMTAAPGEVRTVSTIAKDKK